MPRLSDLLERFRRRVSPPGASGHAPGPVDVSTGPWAELSDVFERVDALDAEADRIRADARRRADEVSARAARTVAETTGRIAEETAAARSAALLAGRRAAEEELSEIHREAQEDATATRERVERALPGLTDDVVASVLSAYTEHDHAG